MIYAYCHKFDMVRVSNRSILGMFNITLRVTDSYLYAINDSQI